MPTGRAGKARNLAPHRDRVEPGGQSVGNGAHERANRPHQALGIGLFARKSLNHEALRGKCVHNWRRHWVLQAESTPRYKACAPSY